MSAYWLITRDTESLLTFRTTTDLLIFLHDHLDRLRKFRVLKNKEDQVVEVFLAHLPFGLFRDVLERS
jgi:hypothetical protein